MPAKIDRPEIVELDADMCGSDVIGILQQLRFGSRQLVIDREARAFLCRALES
jgi:hypothetical protein